MPVQDAGAPDASAPEGEGGPEGEDLSSELQPQETVFPEEMELAKLAIRALYFNISSKTLILIE